MTFRLGAIIPNILDGTSFYRAAGPLQALELNHPQRFKIETGGNITWAYMKGIHALFMQRPYTKDHLGMMAMAKMNGKPVWIDYDDDLFTLPLSNPTHKIYGDKTNQMNILTLVSQADVVSVSTGALRTKLQKIMESVAKAGDQNDAVPHKKLNPEKIVVVPNAYDDIMMAYSFKDWDKPLPPATKTIMWRGSHTHDADLWEYTKEMTEAFTRHGTDWTINFVGSPFWLTLQEMERGGVPPHQNIVTQTMDITEFMHHMFHVRPAAMIVPLKDDLFNRAKSNIAWIEAAHAGALTLAPDWDEWRRPGVINYKNPDDFRNKLSNILNYKYNREELVGLSREFIKKNLTLTGVNLLRGSIIEGLCSIDPWA